MRLWQRVVGWWRMRKRRRVQAREVAELEAIRGERLVRVKRSLSLTARRAGRRVRR